MSSQRRAMFLAALALTVGCSFRLGGTQQRRLVTLDGLQTHTALKVAKEYVTVEQLTALRRAARARFPNLNEADLSSLNLRWLQMMRPGGQDVVVEITFIPNQSGVDAAAVADYLVEQVRDDIRERLARTAP